MKDDLWIQFEELKIRKDMNKNYDYNEDKYTMVKLLGLIGFIFLTSFTTHNSKVEIIHDPKTCGMWGETWTCSNRDCGYENYVGIEYCALCGTKKR